MQNAVKLALLHPSWQHESSSSVKDYWDRNIALVLKWPLKADGIIHHPRFPQSLKWKFSIRTVLTVYSITKPQNYLESNILPPTSSLVAVSRAGYTVVRMLL